MTRRSALVVAALLVASLPFSAAADQFVRYGPALGVRPVVTGAGVGVGSPTVTVLQQASSVTIDVRDDFAFDLGLPTYFSACIDLNANRVCSRAEGDVIAAGHDSVTVTRAIGFGSRITLNVYGLSVDPDGRVALGTFGDAYFTYKP